MGWVRVARAADVSAGKGSYVIAQGRELALFVIEREYFCIENACPHMDGPLSEGDVQGDVVYCPWHWWPINIRTGALQFDPAVCTATYPCRVEGEDIMALFPDPDGAAD